MSIDWSANIRVLFDFLESKRGDPNQQDDQATEDELESIPPLNPLDSSSDDYRFSAGMETNLIL